MTKTFIALAALLAMASFAMLNTNKTSQAVPLHISAAHQTWMLSQSKVYSSPEELKFRLGIFQKNYELVRAHNADPTQTYQMGLNQFSDMTDEEISAKYLGDMEEWDSIQDSAEEYEFPEGFQAPTSVDWRTKGIIPSTVLNQKSCGSCWAFATASMGEASYNLSTGKLAQFSPQ